MGATTGISWTDHTFNAWRGCTKVSEGCRNCYAETLSRRNPAVLGEWGPGAKRVVAAESYWREPYRWNHQAILDGVRRRVFALSLGDVFDAEAPEDAQVRLFDLIEECGALDWLLLTKRPENAKAFLDERYGRGLVLPDNLWLGVSVENQAAADERIPILLQIPTVVRFLSSEPLLGPVDLGFEASWDHFPGGFAHGPAIARLDWVIAGGESGPNARPSHPDWFRSLRDQCTAAGVPFHFKQWGEWTPGENVDRVSGKITVADWGVGRWFYRDEDLSIDYHCDDEPTVYRVGKKSAGRLLDGVEWLQVPSHDDYAREVTLA